MQSLRRGHRQIHKSQISVKDSGECSEALLRPVRLVESEVTEWATGIVGPGDWFTDACALHSGIPHLRVVGWSALQLTAEGGFHPSR
eukprot:1870817-Amphidinium_carterae.2